MKKTKRLSVASLMAAVCVVILSVGSLVESLDISLSILAGLVVMIMTTEYGSKMGWSIFAVAGVLSLFLPLKTPGVFFLALFGWYPIAQKKIQMLRPFLAYVVKEILFNLILVLGLFLSAFVTKTQEATWLYGVTFLLANACFVLYDLLLDRFWIWYLIKIRKRLGF